MPGGPKSWAQLNGKPAGPEGGEYVGAEVMGLLMAPGLQCVLQLRVVLGMGRLGPAALLQLCGCRTLRLLSGVASTQLPPCWAHVREGHVVLWLSAAFWR